MYRYAIQGMGGFAFFRSTIELSSSPQVRDCSIKGTMKRSFATWLLKRALFYCIHRCTKHLIKAFHLFLPTETTAQETERKGRTE